jgi:hypothetical protein
MDRGRAQELVRGTAPESLGRPAEG